MRVEERARAALDAFPGLRHGTPESSAQVVESAPGRVNLIGEHTDYNGGFVLPTVIPQRTVVALRRRPDHRVVVRSAEQAEEDSYDLGAEARQGRWGDYARGVTAALSREGIGLSGFELGIASDVPVGAGLSSSAALEVAILRALRSAFSLSIDDLMIAKLAKWGENEVVGAPVGILDPLACSLGSDGAALFVDCRSLAIQEVALPEAVELVVVDSGVAHDHSTGDYRTRRRECEEAARLLGVKELRDVGSQELGQLAGLPPALARRARHIITENVRVLEAVAALRAGDLPAIGRAFAGSHASMRDDYEISVPAVDALVDRAVGHPRVIGARLTGGGFGGAIVALAERGHGGEVARYIAELPGARALVPAPAV